MSSINMKHKKADLRNIRDRKVKLILKNRRRFVTFIIMLIALVITLSSYLAVSAHSLDSRGEYRTITVVSGDTLWEIAKEYNPNYDIRKLIYEIKTLNNMDTSAIYAGQELIVPVYDK